MIKIREGLDLPISGSPKQEILDGPAVSEVAVLGEDYLGMKPSMKVRVGDKVKCGDEIFVDKKTAGVIYTAPASGTVKAINRGAKRKLLSVVIGVEGDDYKEFAKYDAAQLPQLSREEVVSNIVASGLWPSFRTRPQSKAPTIDSEPAAIFVSVMDTNPLAADPMVIIEPQIEAFNHGLTIIKHLTNGELFVGFDATKDHDLAQNPLANYHGFSGVHPAGNVGTHIHFLKPVNENRTVWHIGYQDVIAIGKLFTKGRLSTDRVISLAGPLVKQPGLIRTRVGANIEQLVAGNIEETDERIISGSVFNGHIAVHHRAYLGKFHNQISVIAEGREKEFFGWIHLGVDKFSVTNAFVSHLNASKRFNFTTTTGGSERAIMPIGTYEQVMPWDILPTQLLRALVTGDTDTAQQLGCLEFDEEDLALCTFVCPGKYEYGPILRDVLTTIEKEG
ncbi:Na(+)-translocating NADH-quinone reductase subunit A [Aliikangiella coralliicola]|uniref:Na(+)-translocating NADH-quinone reductase subunit A n=1 Tax=Aliikangiella coralliicola TaxID=2592383 RepID=A0A545UHP6_9GAMM|nr:Na(+)-translocating NADH-quinone reductase subunit A [Aliikangiella coralliicola]TQV88990.1 Na(+)-translocating NADH-quinone reductase subunit A [Aliikangiella coralliicola]